MMKWSIRRTRSHIMAFFATNSSLPASNIATHLRLTERTDFWIHAAQQFAGIRGVVVQIESHETRVELKFRTGFGRGGRRGGRARMTRPALQDSFQIFAAASRILRGDAGRQAGAGLAALC